MRRREGVSYGSEQGRRGWHALGNACMYGGRQVDQRGKRRYQRSVMRVVHEAWTNEYTTIIRVVAKELVYSLLRLTFSLDIPRGYQGSAYVFGRDVNEWADRRDPRVRFTGFECFTDAKGGISIYHVVGTPLWHSVK